MERRSTNPLGYTHWQYDLTAHVGSSHGVRLSGGSTGGIVEAVGDDTNVTLTLRPQGAAGIQLGAASTSGLLLLQKYRIDWTIPALSSAGAAGASADSTVAVTGLTTSSILLFGQTQVWNSTADPAMIVTVRCSTAAELKVTTHNISASSLSGSTKSGTLLEFRF